MTRYVLTEKVAAHVLAAGVLLVPIIVSGQSNRQPARQPSSRASPSSRAGRWQVESSRDQMTDSVRLNIYVDALSPIRVSYNTITPRLSIQCRSRELGIAFYVGGPSHDEQMDLRFDDGEVFTSSMNRSTNLRWLYVEDYGEHDVIDILTRISEARRLRARFTPFVESPVTFAFEVEGLKPLLPRLERAGCRTTKPISDERSDSSANGKAAVGAAGGRAIDVVTVRSEGVEFPFPGYLNNIVRQIAVSFKPRNPAARLNTEVRFLIHRDGSVSDLTFVRKSGNFSFDLEAQGAVEAASSARGFGPLPSGFPDDVLPVVLSFDPVVDTAQAGDQHVYFEFQVEKPAEMLQDSPKPKYPSVLESSGIAGEVQAQFVVRSDGKADMDSFKVLKSTNELFTQAVKSVLPRMHFSPAMLGGKPVNQLVQQSFQFAVPR